MTLDELLSKTPEPYRPIVRRYGPLLLEWTMDEVWSFIEDLVKGRTKEAWERVMEALSDDMTAFLAAGTALIEDWDAENTANRARMAMQRTAILAILQVLLAACLALVGL